MTLRSIDIKKFWKQVDIRGEDECWPWIGARKDKDGYGKFRARYIEYRAPRVAYFLKHGKWPSMMACHTCDNPPCCNYNHLYDGHQYQNLEDSMNRGRRPLGESRVNSKFTDHDVREIRELFKQNPDLQYSDVSKKYNVSGAAVSAIVREITWTHVK